ncbi:hypothetical protein LEP1GSC027_0983 [Leptospira interrogans str. 2002000624]|nr:hypothetical protein LEP1GSC027_0983 [Leptospira interrogans str. 2002000624]
MTTKRRFHAGICCTIIVLGFLKNLYCFESSSCKVVRFFCRNDFMENSIG